MTHIGLYPHVLSFLTLMHAYIDLHIDICQRFKWIVSAIFKCSHGRSHGKLTQNCVVLFVLYALRMPMFTPISHTGQPYHALFLRISTVTNCLVLDSPCKPLLAEHAYANQHLLLFLLQLAHILECKSRVWSLTISLAGLLVEVMFSL